MHSSICYSWKIENPTYERRPMKFHDEQQFINCFLNVLKFAPKYWCKSGYGGSLPSCMRLPLPWMANRSRSCVKRSHYIENENGEGTESRGGRGQANFSLTATLVASLAFMNIELVHASLLHCLPELFASWGDFHRPTWHTSMIRFYSIFSQLGDI